MVQGRETGNTEAKVRDVSRKTKCAGITICAVCVIVLFIIGIFSLVGIGVIATIPYCDALYFGTEELNTVNLPDLRNLSLSEIYSLETGRYELSTEYFLKVEQDSLEIFSLCVLKRYFSTSACLELGSDLEQVVICGPDMRPDCLPSAIFQHFFGLSLWYRNESTVFYTVLNTDTSLRSGINVTNTSTTLSAVWNATLGFCQMIINMTIAVIFFGALICVCCLGCVGYFLTACCLQYKRKRQLRRQEQVEELALIGDQEENESSDSEPLVEGNDEEAESVGPSEMHQEGLSVAACEDVSSSDEEDVQAQLLPAGRVSSRESVRTAVSERGHRRHGRRNRFVPTNRPTVGYFTDSTSMSGAPTDLSTNDASDEDSNEEVHADDGQLSSSSSSVAVLVQEATRVDTPPLFARLHPTTVYDNRPGVTTEPRQPPDGV